MNLKNLRRVSKREAGALALTVLALGALSFGVWRFFSDTTLFFKNEPLISQQSFSRLIDGITISSESDAIRRPVAVIVDNSTDGQPFQGLGEARLIYETIAEGNITRLLAVYDSSLLPYVVGPVRSVRPYFASWASEVNAVLFHVGGSPDGLRAVESLAHVNEFYDGGFFWRDRARRAPHNIFTSGERIGDAFLAKHFAPTTTFPLWMYASALLEIPEKTISVSLLDVNFSIPQYNVRWEYDTLKKNYKRIRGGEAENLFADSIVVMAVQAKVLDHELRRSLTLLGEGRTWIFTRGGVKLGRWVKKDMGNRTQFVDDMGMPLTLTPGVTWVEVIDDEGKLEF